MKKKPTKKSKYLLMHSIAEEFVKLVRRLERKTGEVINYNFNIKR